MDASDQKPPAEAEPLDRSRAVDPRRLPRAAQLLILALFAAGLAGLVVSVVRLNQPVEVASAPTEAQVSGDTFKPTPNQWKGFKIAAVTSWRFRPIEDTDGRIAIDDDRVTQVFSSYSGRVVRLFVRAGDAVDQGQPLMAVQASEFVQGTNDLISAEATLRTARAQLNLAQTNEHRQHELFLAHGAAQKDWQQSQVDLATAQAGLDTSQIALAAVRNRLRILGKSDQEIGAIEAAPDVRVLNPIATVTAPISGVVIQRQVGVGQTIVSPSNGGTTPQFQIGDLSRVWLVANAREESSSRIKLGDLADVRVPAWPNRVFQAKITFIAPVIDPTTHRLTVRAEIDNDDGALRPEMLARFRIVTGDAVMAPAVPVEALVYEGANVHVWLANPADKTVALRQIEVGLIDGGMAQVTKGLTTADSVVTSGSLFIDRAVTGD